MQLPRLLRLPIVLLLAAVLGGPAFFPQQVVPQQDVAVVRLRAAADLIAVTDVEAHVRFLASDAMRGRDTPSPELDLAADYIARHFGQLGLQPAGDDGGFIQRYSLSDRAIDRRGAQFVIGGPGGRVDFRFGPDFTIYEGLREEVTAVPVFIGPAAAAQTAVAALTGRVAVMTISGTPGPQLEAELGAARAAVSAAGALAAVFILDPGIGPQLMEQLARLHSLAALRVSKPEPIPAVLIRGEAVAAGFRAAGLDPEQLRRRAASGEFAALVLDSATIELRAPVRSSIDARPPNVVAILPGTDSVLRDTYVVLSAHFDHVGVQDGIVYPGADDNASGTAAVLEIARAFGALAQPPPRSLIFLAVSGEEKNLLGSRFFTDHPVVPTSQIVANINLDMVGRNAPDTIYAIGMEFTTIGETIRGVATRHPELRLVPAPDPYPAERLFFRSDQLNFVRLEIPAIFLFTGLHEDYHRPSDTADKVDMDKVARVARLGFLIAHQLAMDPEPPRWTERGTAELRAILGPRRW